MSHGPVCADFCSQPLTLGRGLMKAEDMRNLGLNVAVPEPTKASVKKVDIIFYHLHADHSQEDVGFVAGRDRVSKSN